MNSYYKFIKFYCVLTLLCVSITILNSQYRFTNYDYTHGLPVNNISTIAEDSLGYLWLGSPNGLVQFDGLNFQLYESNGDDSTTLYGSEIADIEVGADGRVWTSFHEGGISVFNHATQNFKSKYYTQKDEEDFPKYAIVNFCIDNELNNIWMVSPEEGVFVMNIETLESKRIISEKNYTDVIIDPLNTNIIFLGGGSLSKVNKHTLDIVPISNTPLKKIIKKGNNIYGYDWSSNTYSIDLSNKTKKIYPQGTDFVNRAIMVHQNELWLGLYDGIHIRNLKTDTYSFIKVDPNNLFSIANNHIRALFTDKDERIWVGTDDGLSVIIPEHQYLKDVAIAGNDRFSDIIPGKDKQEFYLNSFYDNLIKEINLETKLVNSINFRSTQKFANPLKMIRSQNKVWVFFLKGFGYFTDDKKTIKAFNGGNFDSIIQGKGVGDMVIDDQNNIWWCRSSTNILFKISTTKSDIIDTIHFPKLNQGEKIKVLHWDGEVIWLGTDIGICRYNPRTRNKKWMTDSDNSNKILENRIEDINTDKEGNLWVLSLKKGAWKYKYDKPSERLKIIRGYDKKDGLSNNRPWKIDFDLMGNIYFGSISGLSVYNSKTDRMLSLNKQYGFSDLLLSPKILGDKLFILKKGLSYFKTSDLQLFKKSPKVQIKSLSCSNKLFFNKGNQDISLSYKENDIAIDYLTIDLSEARDIHYRYRIHQNDQWSEVSSSQRKAIFNELPPAEYTFEVAAAGKNMVWGPSSFIKFTIFPPFWKTWWFITFSLLSIAGLLYAFYSYRLKQVKHLSGLKTRMAELENEALRSQMNPHFIFNSLNSVKSFIINNRKEEAADYLTVFSDLIRIVLNNSKKRFISLEDEIEALNLYMEIENIRLEDKFSVNWHIDKNINLSSIVIPPLTIQPFVENSIWHGFVHKDGKGELNLSIIQENGNLVIQIKDDGVGREKSKEIEKNHPRKRSFGIEITQQRLDYGKISSEVIINDLFDSSNNSKGTEVILKMPLKNKSSLNDKPSTT